MNKILKTSFGFALLITLFIGCRKENLTPNTGTVTAPIVLAPHFAISNNTLYVVSSGVINSYNITDAATPTFVQSNPVANAATVILANSNNLFTGGYGGLYIYNTALATGPAYIGAYAGYQNCNPIVANNKFAFESVRSGSDCSVGLNQINVIDIATDPKQPKVLYTYPMVQPYGLAVDGDYLFVCDDGLKFYDISTPATPVLKQKITIDAKDVSAQNGKLVITGSAGLSQYSYSSGTLVFASKLPNK